MINQPVLESRVLQELSKKIDRLLANNVVKDDLEIFATKNDLKDFATKNDLKDFATKSDLKIFATKKDFGRLEKRFDNLEKKFDRLVIMTINIKEDLHTKYATRNDLLAVEDNLLTHIDGLTKKYKDLEIEQVANLGRWQRLS